jgi:PAS domain S-box-containing protein
VRTVGASLDITERKRMERSLTESEEKFHTLFESANDAIFILSLEGRFLDINRTGYERLGFTKEEMLSKHISEIVPPAISEKMRERFSQIMKQGHSVFESAHVKKDGTMLPVEINARIAEYGGKQVHLSIARDITERRHMQEQLEQKAAEQNAILENAFVGIAFLKDRRFFWINGKLEQMFGYGRDEVAGLTTELFYPSRESYEELGREAYSLLASGETYNTERLMKRKDGSVFWCSLSGKAIDPAVPAKGAIWILQDITQRRSAEEEIKRVNQNLENLVSEGSRELKQTNKRLRAEIEERKWVEEELIKAQKLESLGILAGGIAHDFNNMLTTILGNLSLAMLDVDRAAPVHRSLETAETAALRAQNLTKQLLTFAKGGSPVKQTVAIGELVRESVAFALRGSRVKYDVSLQDGLWLVEADEDQLVQVMHNLVINADHAMPQGGTISVRCENCKLKDNEALSVAAGKYVRIVVRDTGMGIPKDHLLKIFDPYFTTKQKGSGLGLATVYSVIQKHGGRIFAESKLGDGATFTILLPASDAVAVSRKPVENAVPSGTGKILVMDDEADIRQTACDILERLGYSAIPAADGESVIKLYQEALLAGDPFKAVIMDLTIPGGIGGVETLEVLRELEPDVKAIVSSGYSNDPVMAEYRKYGFAGVVAKPYRVREFGEVVHRVINGTGGGCS